MPLVFSVVAYRILTAKAFQFPFFMQNFEIMSQPTDVPRCSNCKKALLKDVNDDVMDCFLCNPPF